MTVVVCVAGVHVSVVCVSGVHDCGVVCLRCS